MSDRLNSTERWVRDEAPELLHGTLGAYIRPFLRNDDLNGLAHFLKQCAVNDDRQRSAADEEAVRDRLRGESVALKRHLQQSSQSTELMARPHRLEHES